MTYFIVILLHGSSLPQTQVAASNPDAIKADPIDIMKGITDAQAKSMAEFLQFKGDLVDEAAGQIKSLYKLLGGFLLLL